MFSQLCAVVWSALHYPSAAPLCSLHSASSSCDSCVSRSRFAHASSRSCSAAAAVPLSLIFQQRHSIRRRPCHRLLPEDPHPRSAPACLAAPTSTLRRRGVEASPCDLGGRHPSSDPPDRLPTRLTPNHCQLGRLLGGGDGGESAAVAWLECSLLMGPFEEPAARHFGQLMLLHLWLKKAREGRGLPLIRWFLSHCGHSRELFPDSVTYKTERWPLLGKSFSVFLSTLNLKKLPLLQLLWSSF